MKIQCDVCQKEKASVFCSADEAALCDACDLRIHHANKLASKHSRYSLLHPTCKDSPLCDICQKRKALLFCQEDRAILCRECDLPIHRANEHTQKHNRFLLTGVKLSPSSSGSAINTAAASNTSSAAGQWRKRNSSTSNYNQNTDSYNNMGGFVHPTFERSSGDGGVDDENNQRMSEVGSSSISEYLMETLPGWRVDDFLVDPNNIHSSSNNVYCKTFNTMCLATDYDFGNETSSNSSDFPTSWAAPVPRFLPHNYPQSQVLGTLINGMQESTSVTAKSSKKNGDSAGFYRSQFSRGIQTFVL